jgi:hypothetical protein
MKPKSIDKNQTSDSQIFKPRSFNNEKTRYILLIINIYVFFQLVIESNKQTVEIKRNEDENTEKNQIILFVKCTSNQSRHRQRTTESLKESTAQSPSYPVKQTSSVKLPNQTNIIIGTKIEETIQTPISVTPVHRFKTLLEQYIHTTVRIRSCCS